MDSINAVQHQWIPMIYASTDVNAIYKTALDKIISTGA